MRKLQLKTARPLLRGEGKGVRGRCLAYTWDANKNKLSEVLTGVNATVNGTATNRTHGPTHELTAIGASSLSYDAKGNLTQDTSRSPTQNYVWDYDNKMRSADIDGNGSADVSFEYDALGRRVARTQGANAVVYFQVDQQTICDYPRGGAAASPTYRYIWGSYIDELIARKATGTGGAVLFAHRNQQYSIYAYSNSSGAVVERIAYTAYGQPTFMNAGGTVQSTSPNSIRYSYTGREWDASLQLHHFRARWMGPVTGRFLGRDPIGYRGGANLFRNNFLLARLDPRGLRPILIDDYAGPDKIPDPEIPGAQVCVHNTPGKKRCFFPLNSNDHNDDLFVNMGGTGVSGGGLIQGKDAPEHKIYDACSEKGRQEILDKIKNSGCCEIIFAGHQGGAKNPGGICSYPLNGGNDKPCRVFPNADFENKLATIMRSNCKEGCDVFQYSCGGSDPSNSAPGIQQGIANNLGCDFWATKRGDNYNIRKSGNVGDFKCYSFDPKDWQPDPRKRSWCVPFPMTRYKPEIKG